MYSSGLPTGRRHGYSRRVALGLLATLPLVLPSSATAKPACQLIPRAAVAHVLGLPNVSTYLADPYHCGLVAWRKTKPTIPAPPALAKRQNVALRAGEMALLSVFVENGPSVEVSNLGPIAKERTPFSPPTYGANMVLASGEVARNASDVGGAWWWLNPPGSIPEVRRTLVLRITEYHRSFGQLQNELGKVAAVAVPATD